MPYVVFPQISMTDSELIARVAAVLDADAKGWLGLRKGNRLLLALPLGKEAGLKALGLYQPQRLLAKGMVALLEALLKCGCAGALLSKLKRLKNFENLGPPLGDIDLGTCGVLLGSPEHKVRRAIASYRREGLWEVAKVSFGEAGRLNLEREALVLAELHGKADAVPPLLGIHRADDLTLLRMPYLTGQPVPYGRTDGAIQLLESWLTGASPQGIEVFPEWVAIRDALNSCASGKTALMEVSKENLNPVIRHGDFARWNLRIFGNELIALDWEWGHSRGMPGLDLVHYFLQDARLVERLAPKDAIIKTITALETRRCAEYLAKTGWSGNPMLPIVASLAFKQGAGHQDNTEILDTALILMNESSSEQ
jgi:hypothetical protein